MKLEYGSKSVAQRPPDVFTTPRFTVVNSQSCSKQKI